MRTALTVGTQEVPEFIPFGSLGAGRSATTVPPEGENTKPSLAIIRNGM